MERIGQYRVIRDHQTGIPYLIFSLPGAVTLFRNAVSKIQKKCKGLGIWIEDKYIYFTIHKKF